MTVIQKPATTFVQTKTKMIFIYFKKKHGVPASTNASFLLQVYVEEVDRMFFYLLAFTLRYFILIEKIISNAVSLSIIFSPSLS